MLTTVAEPNTATGRHPACRKPSTENSRPIDTNAKIKNRVRRPFTVAISALPPDTHCRYSGADRRRRDEAEHELREPLPEVAESGARGLLALDLQREVGGQHDRADEHQRQQRESDDDSEPALFHGRHASGAQMRRKRIAISAN